MQLGSSPSDACYCFRHTPSLSSSLLLPWLSPLFAASLCVAAEAEAEAAVADDEGVDVETKRQQQQ